MDGWHLALPFPSGSETTSPKGPGLVSAASETPGDWLVRVELAGGGHWVGMAGELSPVHEVEGQKLADVGERQR